MADVYVEYMVQKARTPADLTKKLLLGMGGVAALGIAFLYGPLLGGFGVFAMVAGMVLAVVAYRLIRAQEVEYEYTLTNGEIDVDKITAKRNRKRMYSFHCRDVERLEPNRPGEKLAGKTIAACSHPEDDGVWRCVVKGKTGGVTLLFNAGDPLLLAMKRFLPGQVARDAFRQKEQQP